MGCLTVSILDLTGCSIKTDVAREGDSLAVTIVPVQAGLGTSLCNRNTGVKVTVALVCQVGQSYQRFYVMDGPFIVEEGYFKVK